MPRLGLANVSTGVLKKELQRRLEVLPKLIAERDELNRRIAEIEGVAAAEQAPKPAKAPAPRKKGRRAKPAKNPAGLASILVDVIKTEDSMAIPEAVEGVLATGYKSKSKDFQNLVSMTLANDKRFERVSRGVYRVKG